MPTELQQWAATMLDAALAAQVAEKEWIETLRVAREERQRAKEAAAAALDAARLAVVLVLESDQKAYGGIYAN